MVSFVSFRCDLNFALVLLFATCYMHHCVVLNHVIMIPDCVIFHVLLKFGFGVENLCETSPSAHNIIVKMSEIYHLLKPDIILSFICSYFFSWQIFLKLCTEHGSITAMLCAKFRKNLSTQINVTGKQGWVWFELSQIWDGFGVLKPVTEYDQ